MGPGHELHVSRALAVARPDQRDAFVRNDERGGSTAQVLDGLLENAFQIVGAVIRRRMVGRAVGQQQLEILVERADSTIELVDGDTRHEVAPQTFERRAQQGVCKGKTAGVDILVAVGPTHYGQHREQPGGVVPQPAQVNGEITGENAQLAGAVGRGARSRQSVVHDIEQVGPRGRFARPAQIPLDVEQCDARCPR